MNTYDQIADFLSIAVIQEAKIRLNRLRLPFDFREPLPHAPLGCGPHDAVVVEMRYVDRRIQLIGHALLVLVLSGIGIGVTVGTLFLGELLGQELRIAVQVTFFTAISLLMVALVYLLLETRLVAQTLRLPRALLELDRKDL